MENSIKVKHAKATYLIEIMIFLAILLFFLFSPVEAGDNPDKGFIFGKITAQDGTVYQGPIRWGDEECFWHDMFNSTKKENKNIEYLSNEETEKIRKKYQRENRVEAFFRKVLSLERKNTELLPEHQFVCRFGDIKEIQIKRGDNVLLKFKNGKVKEFSGGSNDIKTNINIIDEKKGERKLKWWEIKKIEFFPVPNKLEKKFGEPLFGTVDTENGSFEGFIQWDHDERISKDKLDGDYEKKDMSIEFGRIKTIDKYKNGSVITLKTGEDYYLVNSNDVNDSNRGIIIDIPKLGRVSVDWDEFYSVNFKEISNPPAGYNDFMKPLEISGRVVTRKGETYTGKIVYDLDEEMDFEIISGSDGEIEYDILIRYIDSIIPMSASSSKINIKDGRSIILGDSRDVNKNNDGVLVWGKNGKTFYIPWINISKIDFD